MNERIDRAWKDVVEAFSAPPDGVSNASTKARALDRLRDAIVAFVRVVIREEGS